MTAVASVNGRTKRVATPPTVISGIVASLFSCTQTVMPAGNPGAITSFFVATRVPAMNFGYCS